MSKGRWLATFLALIALAASAGLHAQASQAIVVERHQSTVKLSLSRAAPLSSVLEVVCANSQLECSGTAAAAGVTLAPMTIKGSLEEVVSRLMEGTRLDYVLLSASSAHSNGKLLIEIPEPLATDENIREVGSSPPAAPAQMPEPSSNSASSGLREDLETSPIDANGSALEPGMASNEDSASSQVPAGSAALPFPDASGNPVYVRRSNDQGNVAPFPGPDGKPLVFPSAGAVGVTVLPFPGSDGRPVEVPRDTNQGSSNPFPPTIK